MEIEHALFSQVSSPLSRKIGQQMGTDVQMYRCTDVQMYRCTDGYRLYKSCFFLKGRPEYLAHVCMPVLKWGFVVLCRVVLVVKKCFERIKLHL